jgi:hypothetical protein
VAVLAAVLLIAPVAGAQTVQTQDELGTEAIDTDTVTDRVGLVDPATGVWNLRGPGGAVNSFLYGNPGDVPFVGDWNCDGIDTPGLYRQSDGFVYLRNSNTQGIADIRFFFGNPGDFPLAGDFNDDGCDTVSIYRESEARIYVINALGANDGGLGPADFFYDFGNPGDKPFVGDFNGDGIDTVGLHRESTGFVYFRNTLNTGIADNSFFFGDPGDRFVSGDWGIVDNIETPAVFRPSLARFFFRYSNTQGNADEELQFGFFRMLPVGGAWEVKLGLSGSLAQGVIGIPYGSQLNVVGSAPPFTVTKTGGAGWASVSGNGLVTGTPNAEGPFTISVRVTDATGRSVDQTLSGTITNGCQANGNVPLGECLALVQLYRATNGWFWTSAANWLKTDTCSWEGVVCAGGRVSEIVLEEHNLSGTISTVPWGSLAGLVKIQLQRNVIGGTIPGAALGQIPFLVELDLSGNGLTGPVPTFPAPANLSILDLAENNLTGGVPAGLNGETTLRLLDLASNDTLGGTLPVLSGLVNLTDLDLSESAIGGTLTNQLNGLPAIVVLDIHGNLLTGTIPASLASPDKPAITDLDLAENQFAGDIGDLTPLNTLTVPGGLVVCGNAGLTIGGSTAAQPANPLWVFVNARDSTWFTTCS